MIRYTEDAAELEENMLDGFFVGWPRRPSKAQHLAVLRGSFRVVLAIDDTAGRVVGFVNMISDGVLTAFIPWLEVLPAYQGQGIGTELMRRVLDCEQMYSIDLVCDEPLLPYYARLGMTADPGRRHTQAIRLAVTTGARTTGARRVPSDDRRRRENPGQHGRARTPSLAWHAADCARPRRSPHEPRSAEDAGSTTTSHSARNWCPVQRILTWPTPSTPGVPART